MVISQRLKTIINCVQKSSLLVDVGTDHAYIPIYLIQNKIIIKAIAADVSKGSAMKAQKNINFYNYSDCIEVRVGYGLKVISDDEFPEQIVIAGMGGLLISDILNASKNVVNSSKRIILQPQKDICTVRKTIHSLGLKIIDEKMLFEDGKFYNIIVCENGFDSTYTERDYFLGKILIESKNNFLKAQAEFELNKINKILSDMNFQLLNNKKNSIFLNRFKEINQKKLFYESILIN